MPERPPTLNACSSSRDSTSSSRGTRSSASSPHRTSPATPCRPEQAGRGAFKQQAEGRVGGVRSSWGGGCTRPSRLKGPPFPCHVACAPWHGVRTKAAAAAHQGPAQHGTKARQQRHVPRARPPQGPPAPPPPARARRRACGAAQTPQTGRAGAAAPRRCCSRPGWRSPCRVRRRPCSNAALRTARFPEASRRGGVRPHRPSLSSSVRPTHLVRALRTHAATAARPPAHTHPAAVGMAMAKKQPTGWTSAPGARAADLRRH